MARLMFLSANLNENNNETSEVQEELQTAATIYNDGESTENYINEDDIPSTDASSTEVPSTETPSTETPSTEVPSTETPSTETPSTEVPSTETPSSETTSTETPSSETPSSEIPSSETPSSETTSSETSETDTSSTDTSSTDVIGSIETSSTTEPIIAGEFNVLSALPFIAVFILAIITLVFMKFSKKSKANKNIQTLEPATVKMGAGRGLCVKVSNVHNVGKRDNQQDSFGMSMVEKSAKNGVLAVVADGMGGLEAGAESSSIITNCMLGGFKSYLTDGKDRYSYNSQDFLLQLLKLSNEQVVKMLKAKKVNLGGSTLVAVLIKDNLFDFISVGDSRIALLRAGTLTTINREHTYAVELDERMMRGEISFEEAKNNSQRKSLTSYVGMDKISQVDRSIQPIPLVSGDKLILMSDGIFGTLSDEEIVQILSSNDVYASASMLEQSILNKNRSAQDNFTAIIIEIEV